MQDHTFTLIVAAAGIGGTLSGIVIGHFLTRSSQHRQWSRDNRKEEFKEVVSAMSRYIVEHMSYTASQGSDLPQSRQAYLEAMKAAHIVLCGCVYIHGDLGKLAIPKRFVEIMEHFRSSGTEFDDPADKAGTLLEEIIAIARKG